MEQLYPLSQETFFSQINPQTSILGMFLLSLQWTRKKDTSKLASKTTTNMDGKPLHTQEG